MMRLLLLLFLFCGTLLAQKPTYLFVDGSFLPNKGIGVGITHDVAKHTNLYTEFSVSRPVAVTWAFGVTQNVLKIKNGEIGLSFDTGPLYSDHSIGFMHEYAIGYTHAIAKRWTVAPYYQYGLYSGQGAWAVGALWSWRWKNGS